MVAEVGAVVILRGLSVNRRVGGFIRDREMLRVAGDPWNGRTFGMATASPPQPGILLCCRMSPRPTPIGMPSNACARVQIQPGPRARVRAYRDAEETRDRLRQASLAVVTGFALIWHIWWMAGAGLVGAFLSVLVFAFRAEEEVEVPVEQDCPGSSLGHPAEVFSYEHRCCHDDVDHEALPTPARPVPAKSDRRRLRLLDLPLATS